MSDPDRVVLVEFARTLAVEAAGLLPPRVVGDVRVKMDESVVTDADVAIERHVAERIRVRFPDHAVVGEESSVARQSHAKRRDARWCWVIDPLDGTRNYAVGLPCCATSIGVLEHGTPVAGVIYEHHTRATYWAVRGGGAFCEDVPMHVRDEPLHGESLVAFPSSKDAVSTFVATRWITRAGLVPRNLGSTAYHLALLAAGALDAVFAHRCKIWDIAAGALMVEEAGGVASTLTGSSLFPWNNQEHPTLNTPILAACAAWHHALLNDMTPAPGRDADPPDGK